MDFKDECQTLFDQYVACYRARDAEGCSLAYSEDAELYSPYGPPAFGRGAIAKLHEEWVQEGGENKQIEVRSAGSNGVLGWCIAFFRESEAEGGSSMNILARQADGTWLITHCSLNEL